MVQKLKNNNLIAFVLIASAISISFALPWLFSVFNGTSNYYGLYVDRPAYKFSLSNTTGKEVRLETLSGSYVYLMFGFTHCQEVCPLQLANILALDRLIDDKNVRFAFITLDPDRDTGDVLKQYFEIQGENFIALRPESFTDSQELARHYYEYAYLNGRKNNQAYDINHNGYLFLLGPRGNLKLIYTSTQLNHIEMLQDIKKLIKKA